jgi:hypothetical protein
MRNKSERNARADREKGKKQDVEKKKRNTPREADSGGNMGAGKSGKEGMGSENRATALAWAVRNPVSPDPNIGKPTSW